MSDGAAVLAKVWTHVLPMNRLHEITKKGQDKNKQLPFTITAMEWSNDGGAGTEQNQIVIDRFVVLKYDTRDMDAVNEEVFWFRALLCGSRLDGFLNRDIAVGREINPPVLVFLAGSGEAADPLRGVIHDATKLIRWSNA